MRSGCAEIKEENLGSIQFVLDAFIADGAITVPERYTTVPRFELEQFAKHGPSPWTPAQFRPLIAAYLETRYEGGSHL